MNAPSPSTPIHLVGFWPSNFTPRQKVCTVLGVIIAILAIIFITRTFAWHNTPEYALKQLLEIKSPSDLENHKRYLTDQGYSIFHLIAYLTQGTSFNPEFGAAVLNGETCSIPFHDPTTDGKLLFEYDKTWRLNDIFLTKLKGRPCNAEFSAIVEPLRSLINALSETQEQLTVDTRYMTERGKRVQPTIKHKGGDDSPVSSPIFFGDPIVGIDMVQFPIVTADGKNEIRYNVVHDNGWRFDDIVFVRMSGADINMTQSYALDHPILAGFKMSWSIPMFGQ